jgi:biopolymer transport protein ExbD
MSQPFGMKRHRRRPHINLTSLIDVMFLLLIFFMVSSTFRHGFGIEVDLPKAETAAESQLTPEEIVIDERGNYYFSGKPVNEAGLREAIIALLNEDPEATLILRADEASGFGRAIAAIDIARSVGGSRLIIPTEQPAGEAPIFP